MGYTISHHTSNGELLVTSPRSGHLESYREQRLADGQACLEATIHAVLAVGPGWD
jgi:hypothetical protein